MVKRSSYIRFTCIIIVFVLLTVTFILNRVGETRPSELHVEEPGRPLVLRRDTDRIYSGIRQIAADDQYLYVLYGSYGVVQVYDLRGAYQYTIALYSHENGAFRIAVQEGALLIADKLENLFESFLDKTEAATYLEDIPFDSPAENYVVKLSSVWRVSPEGDTACVIKRPVWLVF